MLYMDGDGFYWLVRNVFGEDMAQAYASDKKGNALGSQLFPVKLSLLWKVPQY